MTVTKDELHRLVDALPDTEVAAAGHVLAALVRFGDDGIDAHTELIEPEMPSPSKKRLTAVRHAAPIGSIDDLRGDFWPEDEDADEFDATIRRWRDSDVCR